MVLFRRLRLAAALLPCLLVLGCHSAMVDATISNHTSQTLRLLELDYPSASFGVQTLAAGADFHYRFKILGSDALKLTFTSPDGKQLTVQGPSLHEHQEGPLRVIIGPDGVTWDAHLHE